MVTSNSIFSKTNQYRKRDIIDDLIEESKQIVVGVLVRVSTDMQANDGDSLEMQHELAEQYVKGIGGIIYKFYVEDGLSASKVRVENRPKVQELMQDVRDGKINYIIAYKRDRMFRNTIEHMQFLQFIADHDCDIYFSARGELQLDLSTFKVAGVSKMMESMLSTMAEMESATTSARVSDTMISKASKGERTGGRLPFGYEQVGDKVVPIEGAKDIIEIIEDLYLNGYGVKSISKWLNGGEVKGLNKLETPFPKLSVHTTSDEWNQRNVKTILFNPIYTGHNSYQSRKNSDMDRIVELSEQITPMRTMERQQQIFELQLKKTNSKKPPRAYNTPFILAGLVYCGECGSQLKTQTTQKKDGIRYSYYKCSNRETDKAKKCSLSRIYRKEILEKMVLEHAKDKLSEFLDSDVYDIYRKKDESDKGVVSTHIDSVADKIKELSRKLKQYANQIIELDTEEDQELKRIYINEQKQVLHDLNELKETHAKLVEEIEKDETDEFEFTKFLELARNFAKIIDNASVGIQKQILEGIFSNIEINNNGDVKLDFKLGISKKENSERIINDSERKLATPSFIGLDTIRDGRVPKDINGRTVLKSIVITRINDWSLTFNYFETLRLMFEKVRLSFYPFICSVDPKFNIENVDLIDEKELIDYVPSTKVKFRESKKLNTYIEQTLGITKSTRTRLTYGHLPPYKKIKEHLGKLNTNIEEFLNYVKSQYTDFIIDHDIFEEVESTVNSKSIQTEYLFKDIIKCSKCGSNYIGVKEGKGVRYRCIKNRPSSKYRCYSPRIKEPILIELFERHTGKQVSRDLLINLIENITVVKNDKALIDYRYEVGVLNDN